MQTVGLENRLGIMLLKSWEWKQKMPVGSLILTPSFSPIKLKYDDIYWWGRLRLAMDSPLN